MPSLLRKPIKNFFKKLLQIRSPKEFLDLQQSFLSVIDSEVCS